MNYTQPQYGQPAEYVTAHTPASAYSSGYEAFQPTNNFLNHSTTYAGHNVSQDRYSFSGEVAQAPQQQAPSYVAYPSYTEQTNYAAQTKSWEDNTAPVYGTTKPTYTTYSVGTPSVRGARGRGRGESRGRGRGAGRGASTGTWSSAGRGGSDRGRGGARGRGGRGGERGGRGGRGGWNSDGGDFKRMYPKKKNEGPWTASGKHPMMALMEFKPGTVFEEVTRTQCVKTKIWTIKMSCNVEGRAFEGSGVTVKIAKAEAAIQALRALNVNGVYTMLPHIPEKEKSKIERLNQNSLTVALIPATIPSIPAKKMKYNNDPSVDPQVTVPQPDENLPTPETHPIMFVNQTYGPDIKTEFEIVNDQTRPPIFRCTMVVQGTTFIEMGPSKKKARHSCAEICLARFKQNPPPVVNVTKPKEERKTKRGEREKIVVVTGPLTFEDKLLDRCYQELSVISKDLNPRYIKMRNFAAVIVKDGAGEDLEKCETVVMATGTSCVYLENMKPDGSIVHDCTADSLARRGLKLYLYDELAKAVEGKVSIFRETGTRQNKKFSLKPTISLILLKNVAPGGDGRVNKGTSEKQEMMNLNRKRKFEETAKPGEEVPFELKPYIDGSLHVFFNRKETTIPPYQVLKGQTPHVIASPCDKIALHNICGYQGALLSHFVEPVYITTFGIKALYNEEILKRAFYDRIATVSGISGVTQIPSPFKLSKPPIMPIQGQNRSQTFHTGFAFIWIKNRDFEVLRVPFGKRQTLLENFPKANPEHTDEQRKAEHDRLIAERDASCIPSSLCKQAMFGNYRLICGRLGKVPQASYKEAKQGAVGYQKVKQIVYDKFVDGGLGHWPVKEEDLNTFTEFIARQ